MCVADINLRIFQQMNSDNQGDRSRVKINAQMANQLKQNFTLFKQIFEDEQSKFNESDQTEYYIVSSKYLKQWIQFCSSSESQRLQPIPLNQDLMDAGGQLRKGLVQKADFEIVSEKIYRIVKGDKGFPIQRHAIFIENQKRVPVYLDFINYLKINHKDVHDIDYKHKFAQHLKIKQIQVPIQGTVGTACKIIKKTQNMGNKYKIRLWKNNTTQLSTQKIYKYIKEKTERLTVYRFDGLGKHIEDATLLEDLNLQKDDYFIAQVSDQYQSWFFKSPDQSKCQGCYKYKKLPFLCGCKLVAYCTQECQQKDKRFHLKDCKYAEQQELNEEIVMNFTSSSSRGRVGLSNLGNTCFMNSCLQCLSNTTPLTEYFYKKYFEVQINKQNPLGSRGTLARNYAKFIKNMWCQSQSTFSPHNLKRAVAKLNPIFSGYAQHDSQEFFSFLVDGIHQDLNRVIKKPYVQSVQSKGRKDEVVALESWIAHTQRNQSIIVDLMTGQYKSKVICPQCKLQSITFDPFTTVSLPIPQEPTVQTLKYFVIFNNAQKEAYRMSLQYTKASPKEWLQKAIKLLNRQPEDFVFYILTIYQSIYNFEKTPKSQILKKIQQNKNVFLLQLSQQQKKINQKLQITTKFAKQSSSSKQFDNLWFKRPFYFEKDQVTVLSVYKRVAMYISNIYVNRKSNKNKEQYIAQILKQKPFTLVLKYQKTTQRYYGRVQLKFQKEFKLTDFNAKLIQVMQELKTDQNDCQLDVRFTKQTVKYFEFQKLKKFSDQQDMGKGKKSSGYSKSTVTLGDCFALFQEKQQLQHGNEWYCPRCKQHRLATKEMTIYKAPEILILHLKRFKNKGTYRKEKNETNVIFPLQLNISQYVIDNKPMSSYVEELKKQGKYIQPSFQVEYKQSSPIYQLYAISNHSGGLGGGHYTAYGKNHQKWYQFNDSYVHSVSQDDIKGSGAYMLFYRRKDSFFIK